MADALYDEIEKIHGEIANQERDRLVLNEPPRESGAGTPNIVNQIASNRILKSIVRPSLTMVEIRQQIMDCMEMVRN